MTKSLEIRHLDRIASRIGLLGEAPPGKRGWIGAVRRALGITSSQLAARLGLEQSGVAHYERREREGTITMASLRRAAAALECDLVYGFVPRAGSFAAIVSAQATRAAEQQLAEIEHTMALEEQPVDPDERRHQLEELAERLGRERPSWIWNEPPRP